MKYIIWIDVETTGLDPLVDSPIELALRLSTEDGVEVPVPLPQAVYGEPDYDWTVLLPPPEDAAISTSDPHNEAMRLNRVADRHPEFVKRVREASHLSRVDYRKAVRNEVSRASEKMHGFMMEAAKAARRHADSAGEKKLGIVFGGWHVLFDISMLSSWERRWNVSPIWSTGDFRLPRDSAPPDTRFEHMTVDAKTLFWAVYGKSNLCSGTSLQSASMLLSVSNAAPHSAMSDVVTTMRVYERTVRMLAGIRQVYLSLDKYFGVVE